MKVVGGRISARVGIWKRVCLGCEYSWVGGGVVFFELRRFRYWFWERELRGCIWTVFI